MSDFMMSKLISKIFHPLLPPAYKADLEKDLTRDCSEGLRVLITALLKGGRDMGAHVSMDRATSDAQALLQVMTPKLTYFIY